ncbi:hypothetical protein HNQ02_000604 [Flavobacterium sp. 7E]|uniref:hypothetical protein n=1 Tax=Flavobacterium sp. 7E TaxID=2735898 RepID=UPI0015704561|nr:hypothetical protein [Flavobacterium sp. 7E]NRS87697.1 hypothetical protein [Flavobacterium sp. 7E]
MKNYYQLYKAQHKRAKEILHVLEFQKTVITNQLKKNPICPNLNKDLKTVELEIKITHNEIEQAEADIELAQSSILKIIS